MRGPAASRTSPPGRSVVLYDGDCGFCTRSVRAARRLDWLPRVRWLDFREPAARPLAASLDSTRLEREMAHVSPEGTVRWGFDAWREVLGRFPSTFLIRPLLHLPPVAALGRRAYAWVAANRHRLGETEACALPVPPTGGEPDAASGHSASHGGGGGC